MEQSGSSSKKKTLHDTGRWGKDGEGDILGRVEVGHGNK
jgi:hypothetical protein